MTPFDQTRTVSFESAKLWEIVVNAARTLGTITCQIEPKLLVVLERETLSHIFFLVPLSADSTQLRYLISPDVNAGSILCASADIGPSIDWLAKEVSPVVYVEGVSRLNQICQDWSKTDEPTRISFGGVTGTICDHDADGSLTLRPNDLSLLLIPLLVLAVINVPVFLCFGLAGVGQDPYKEILTSLFLGVASVSMFNIVMRTPIKIHPSTQVIEMWQRMERKEIAFTNLKCIAIVIHRAHWGFWPTIERVKERIDVALQLQDGGQIRLGTLSGDSRYDQEFLLRKWLQTALSTPEGIQPLVMISSKSR